MAWWQKKLLRYALSRTGLLDEKALDLDKLDIALGKKNVIELKDVGLNIERIAKLAQLPASLRVETARVLSLRLTVPADIYQSSIVAEIDGVELSLRLVDEDGSAAEAQRSTNRPSIIAGAPPHRKTHRRLHSPPPYDPGGSHVTDRARIPTTDELARSFLLDELPQRRRELEASMIASERGLEESTISESSNGDDLGTGTGIGLPGFLGNFLQGIVDRLQVIIQNVDVKVHVNASSNSEEPLPMTLRLRVGHAELSSTNPESTEPATSKLGRKDQRQLKLSDLSFHLSSGTTIFSDLSDLSSQALHSQSGLQSAKDDNSQSLGSEARLPSFERPATSATHDSFGSAMSEAEPITGSRPARDMRQSVQTVNEVRFADARQNDLGSMKQSAINDLEIRPGDDNVSWGSRRSKSSVPAEDLWESKGSEEFMPASLLLAPDPVPRSGILGKQRPSDRHRGRDVSPPDHDFQSPGSWPQLEESPERRRYYQSPGSWPTLDQSQQSLFQPLGPVPSQSFQHDVDNRDTALEASVTGNQGFDTPPELAPEPADDLAESRIFTHEEAQSMYLSAMAPPSDPHIPGGWGFEDDHYANAPSMDMSSRETNPLVVHSPNNNPETVEEQEVYTEPQFSTPGNVTPRAKSPERASALEPSSSETLETVSCQLLAIDHILITIPTPKESFADGDGTSPSHDDTSSTTATERMPGAFSMYSSMSASQRKLVEHVGSAGKSAALHTQDSSQFVSESTKIIIAIEEMTSQLDMPCVKLLYRLASKGSSFRGSSQDDRKKSNTGGADSPAISLSIRAISLAFTKSARRALLAGYEPVHNLLTLRSRHIRISSDARRNDISIGHFATFIGSSGFLSFSRSYEMNTSVIIDEQTPDIVCAWGNRNIIRKRSAVEITVETLPLEIHLDLPTVDDGLDFFGGLSGLLEVGSSMLSRSGISGSSSSPSKPGKGVRFEGQQAFSEETPEIKINARIGGVMARLKGSTCSLQLRTQTFKAVHREQGTSATTGNITLTGPYLDGDDVCPLTVELSALRFEYLTTPQHSDLEHLLALLMPSKDKYDNDGDILDEVLLRQRKKGTLLRASIKQARFTCTNWEWLNTLSALGNEVSKFSAVAKYLPEDDRPGMLTLLRVNDVEARLPVTDSFGPVTASATEFYCAHVGVPSLLALSVLDVRASTSQRHELIHPLVRLSGSENLPMVMARMLGYEEEPAINIKLFNICVEYSVSTLLALSKLGLEANDATLATQLAQSAAGLATGPGTKTVDQRGPFSDTSESTSKETRVNLMIHNSAVGLSPMNLASKGLLVLTDARFSAMVPPDDTVIAHLSLHKAGLFVADVVSPEGIDVNVTARGVPSNMSTQAKLTSSLSKQGFVSVGSIRAGKVDIRAQGVPDSGEKVVNVDVRNELLLLETCADSTQTLIAVLSGLAPPQRPSKQPQYLTEPMTIEDMMASFTGDAFEKPVKRPDTLFDVEEESEDEPEFVFDSHTVGDATDPDGLMAESEMTESLYGPVSGILGDIDEPEDLDEPQEFPETVQSLLEDDPFEMAISPVDSKLSDSSLMRELNKQSKAAVADKPVHLGIYEIEDLGNDTFEKSHQVFSSQSPPATTIGHGRKAKHDKETRALPFTVKLRDINIIWNVHDGYDWQRTREGITQAVEQVETKAEERKARIRQPLDEPEGDEAVIGDFLFNSIYIGVPSTFNAQELRRHINRDIDDLASETESVPMSGISKPTTAYSSSGRPVHRLHRGRLKLERSKAHKIAFDLKGVNADILVYPEDSADLVSSVDVRIKDFEIFDQVPTSTWRKFLTHMTNDPTAREMSKPMFHIELLNIRTLENFAASEIALHVSVLPLRLHVDQDALDFITRFFEFKENSVSTSASASNQPFLQRVEVDTVDLRLDYKPKKVDYMGLRSGHTTEFMNFIILEAADIRLRHAIIYGIKGFEPLHKTLNDIWMPDVKRNQLPTVLAGLAPVRSLVNIGTGVRDVVAIPVREYKKDGRVVRSIQKGAFQFGKTTASELARLGAKVAMGTQTMLKGAEGLLTPTSASPGRPDTGRRRSLDPSWNDGDSEEEANEPRAISAYANQPLGVLSGLRSARRYLEYDLLTARDALIAVQGEVLESSGAAGAAAAVARHAPTVILRPIIGTSRAVGTALLGVGNQFDRSNAQRLEDKYKKR